MPVHHGSWPVNRRVRGVESNTTARTRYGRSFRRSGSKSLTLTLTLTLTLFWFFPLRPRLPLVGWGSAILSTSKSVVRSIWIDAGPSNTALAVNRRLKAADPLSSRCINFPSPACGSMQVLLTEIVSTYAESLFLRHLEQ